MGVLTWWWSRRVQALVDRSETCFRAQRWGDAETAAREAAGLRARLLGHDAPLTLACRLMAANALYYQYQWADAERELRECLELAPASEADGPLVAQLRTVLASTLRLTCRLEEAETVARAALAAHPKPPSLHRQASQDVLALVLGDLGHHGEAADLLEATAAARARRTTTSHVLVLKGRSDRLQHLVYLGRHDVVAAEAKALKAACAGAPGPTAALVTMAASNAWAASLSRQGRFDEAENLLNSALKHAQGQGVDRFEYMLRLGRARALTGQGRAEEALSEVEASQALCDRMPHQLAHDLSVISLARAVVLLALRRPADAKHEAQRGLSLCEQSIGARHHRALEARTLLGEALAGSGQAEKAAEGLHAVLGDWSAHFGDHHHGTVRARKALAAIGDPG